MSSSIISNASNIQTQNNASSTAGTNNNGSSSPAFISLFRNIRGSIKHGLSNSSEVNSINSSFRQSTLNQTPNQTQIYENEKVDTNQTTPISIVPKISRTNSNSTFKATSPSNEIKHDYSNCISQLQSAAAQAINHQQNSSHMAGSNLSPSEVVGSHFSHLTDSISNSAPAPVLFRNSKFNQSINSNHSNTNNNNGNHLNNLLLKLNENTSNYQNNQPIMSTFKDSSQSIVNNATIEARKCN
jgi:hypothetical protein